MDPLIYMVEITKSLWTINPCMQSIFRSTKFHKMGNYMRKKFYKSIIVNNYSQSMDIFGMRSRRGESKMGKWEISDKFYKI